MEQLYEAGGDGIELKSLVDAGEAQGYTRGNIYSARDLLGDRIIISGTGKAAHWTINDNSDGDSISKVMEAQ